MKLLLPLLLFIAVSGRGQDAIYKALTARVELSDKHMVLAPYKDIDFDLSSIISTGNSPKPKSQFNEPYQIPGIINLRDTVNIADYGAIPDGPDNGPLIKKIIDRNNGKLIWVPAGVFYTSKITINAGSNIFIDGIGTLKATDSTKVGEHVLQLENLDNVRVGTVTLDGNKGLTPGNHNVGVTLLKLWRCSNVTVYGTTFQNNGYLAISAVLDTNVFIIHSNFNNTDVGVLTQGGNCGIYVLNNHCAGGTSEFVSVWGRSPDFRDNSVYAIRNEVRNKFNSSAFHVRYGDNLFILQNTAIGCMNGFGTEKNAPSYLTVSGNFFTNCNRGISANAMFSNFDNNTITNCVGSGIWIGKDTLSGGNYVMNNTITNVNAGNTGDDGIRITRSFDAHIINNKVTDDRLVALNYSGIRVSGKECNSVALNKNIVDRSFYNDIIIEKGAVNTTLFKNIGKVLTFKVVK